MSKHKNKQKITVNEGITYNKNNLPKIWFFGDFLSQGNKFKLNKPSPEHPLWLTTDISYAQTYSNNGVCFVLFLRNDFKSIGEILDFRKEADVDLVKLNPAVPKWLVYAFHNKQNLFTLQRFILGVSEVYVEKIDKCIAAGNDDEFSLKDIKYFREQIENKTKYAWDDNHYKAEKDMIGYTVDEIIDIIHWCWKNLGRDSIKNGVRHFESKIHEFLYKHGVGGYINIDSEAFTMENPVLVLLGIENIESVSVKALDANTLHYILYEQFKYRSPFKYYKYRLMNYKSPRLRAKAFIQDYKKAYMKLYGKFPDLSK